MPIRARRRELWSSSQSLTCCAFLLATGMAFCHPVRAQEAGANTSATSNDLPSTLDQAIIGKRWEEVFASLEKGATLREPGAALDQLMLGSLQGELPKNLTLKICRILLPASGDLNAVRIEGRTPLIWAAFLDAPALAELVLEQGAAVDTQDASGRTALAWAEITGSASVRTVLLKAGADSSLKDKEGKSPQDRAQLRISDLWELNEGKDDGSPPGRSGPPDSTPGGDVFATVAANQPQALASLLKARKQLVTRVRGGIQPLHLAAALGFQDVAEVLLKAGARWDVRSSDRSTPVELATRAGRTEMVMWLMGKVPPKQRPLLLQQAGTAAIKCGQNQVLHTLLASGWRPASESEGAFALVRAVQSRDQPLIQAVLKAGVVPGAFHVDRDLPWQPQPIFEAAATTGDVTLLKLLIAALNAESRKAALPAVQDALPVAVLSGSQEMVEWLLDEFSLDINRMWEDHRGLHSDRIFSKPDAFRTRRGYGYGWGYNDRGQTDPGTTTMSCAVSCNDTNMVKLLLARGARPEGRTFEGRRLVAAAVFMENVELTQLLLDKGTPPDAPNSDGSTALHEAASVNRQDLADLLLKHGARLDSLNDKKQTPAQLARTLGHNKLAGWLEAPRPR